MCGIFSYKGIKYSKKDLKESIDLIKYRGPDNTQYLNITDDVMFAFHRLAIVGLNESGNQPMYIENDNSLALVCNGEIYNYKILAEKYNFTLTTGSDCEIILHMFKKFGIEKTVKELDGVFMFVICDIENNILYSSRDPFGVRPGFIGYDDEDIYISSEAKSLTKFCSKVIPFKPGHYWSSKDNNFKTFFKLEFINNNKDVNTIYNKVNRLLNDAVLKRLMSDRKIGCLLSGGLDSSLIASLVAREYKDSKVETFSIGMPGSIDLKYADDVAKYIGSNHHNVEISEDDFLNAIEEVIYKIESYDITTVRASVGNYLVSKYIRENTDCKVIFNGDGSDEVCCGYFYLKNAPSLDALQNENKRLLDEIYLFDVLRSDRSISSNGLEPRTPFLDKKFVQYYFSLNPSIKQFDAKNKIEKYVLRKAFENDKLLPDEVLWRNKCAFSDGVSKKNKSWHTIIQSYLNNIIADDEFNKQSKNYPHCPPISKESYYYRKIYVKYFGNHDNLIPHFWMPRWTDTNDPSARELNEYKED
tara:strand:+ start:660 stop:2246 length:1587 start_codon:yes stop_codon:yes gene_type:complete